MSTHDELAYAVAVETVGHIRSGSAPWSGIFSTNSRVTSSRAWPVPDFVIVDETNRLTVAAEFKPPRQTKREYLTGLGQALAYTRDFNYGLLIVPTIADDNYRIADHIAEILSLPDIALNPVGLITYDAGAITAHAASGALLHFFSPRAHAPVAPATLSESFYAKWREASAEEIGQYLEYLYDEGRTATAAGGTIRDRAFNRLWVDIQAGRMHHWGGGVRTAAPSTREGVMKNYRNFTNHIGWMETDGSLTHTGLQALHVKRIYGCHSQVFKNTLAQALLLAGKHLILINAINEFQDSNAGGFVDEQTWLNALEANLASRGLLRRNPGRHAAAVQHSARGFLKAEKQIWKVLGLIVPYGARVFHPHRGFIFNWARITDLLRD